MYILWSLLLTVTLILVSIVVILLTLSAQNKNDVKDYQLNDVYEMYDADAYEIIPINDSSRTMMFTYYHIDNNDALKYALYTYGPLWVSFKHMPNDYSKGAVYTPSSDDNGAHSLLLIGYNAEANHAPYWILKNSWGEDYGNFQLVMNTQLYDFAFYDIMYGINFKDENTRTLWDVPLRYDVLSKGVNQFVRPSSGVENNSRTFGDGNGKKGFGVVLPTDEERQQILRKIKVKLTRTNVNTSVDMSYVPGFLSYDSNDNPLSINLCGNSFMDQRQCGSCWVFAFCALFTSYMSLYTHQKYPDKTPICTFISAQAICEYFEDCCNGGFIHKIDKNIGTIPLFTENACVYICTDQYHPSACMQGLCHFGSNDRPVEYGRGAHQDYDVCRRNNPYRNGCHEDASLYYYNCIPGYTISTIDFCTKDHYSRGNKPYCLGSFAGGKYLTKSNAERICRERQGVDRCDRVGSCYYPRCRDGYHTNQADGLECIADDYPSNFPCDNPYNLVL